MRSSGVLLNVSSLYSDFGIGGFGSELNDLADFICQGDLRWWQVLPITTIGKGNSPYSGVSAFAGNYLYIDPIKLLEKGYINQQECDDAKYHGSPYTVDYAAVSVLKKRVLKCAFQTIAKTNAAILIQYLADNRSWLLDYSLFMVLTDMHEGKPWYEWPDEYKSPKRGLISKLLSDLDVEIGYYVCEQFLFAQQWAEGKEMLNKRGIGVIGDMPIYVSRNSADVWANPELFLLDADLNPTKVAGVPPDYFAKDGQLWGNPIYNYSVMKKDKYSWFVARIGRMLQLYDKLRIDHFRAFDRYWSVPFEAETAREGEWVNGVGIDLFNVIKEKFPNADIIAEDLGIIDDGVTTLRRKAGFPGMRVMQFSLGGSINSVHSPHMYERDSVVYTGTHDNDTTYSWLMSLSHDEMAKISDYIGEFGDIEGGENSKHIWSVIRILMISAADTVIIPFQDLVGWGTDTRMNTPGVAEGNWVVRITQDSMRAVRLDKLRRYNYISGRVEGAPY